MPFPPGTPTITLTGTLPAAAGGTGYQGRVVLTPSAYLIDAQRNALYPNGSVVATITDGAFTAEVIPCDAPGIQPTGWRWQISIQPTGGPSMTYWANITGTGTIDLADITPVPAPAGGTGSGPVGPTGPAGPQGEPGPAGPAGGTLRTASARITDGDLSDLPNAPAWTIVQTSAGTKLQASIAAAAGDRIKVCGRFMYSGGHFLDWALLDNTGALALYAASETSSPLAEGNPSMYPSLSFDKATAADMFTVGAGHIDGTGKATVALAHQGTNPGKVYAHLTYPWRLRLENIGPEPA